MLARPIRVIHDDDFHTEIVELADGGLRVTVAGPGGRSWASEKPTIEEAIAVAARIRREQQPA